MTDNNPICILGMARSGTSLVAQIINDLGYLLGDPADLFSPSPDNLDGYFENGDVGMINEELLAGLSRSWANTQPLSTFWYTEKDFQKENKKTDVFIGKMKKLNPLWGFKDPKTSILLPFWMDAFKRNNVHPKFLIVFRNPLDVAKSLEKREKFDLVHSLGLWLLYNLSAIRYTNNCERIFVSYDDLINHGKENIMRIIQELDLNVPFSPAVIDAKIERIIKPNLRHNANLGELEKKGRTNYFQPVISLYKLLLQTTEKNGFGNSSAFIDQINEIYSTFENYGSLASSFTSFGDIEWNFIQLYWLDHNEENFTEAHASVVNINKNIEDYSRYVLPIPGIAKRQIRLDITNFPAYVEIESIKIINPKGEQIENIPLNDPNKIQFVNNIEVLENSEKLRILCLTGDPIILLNLNPMKKGNDCELEINMKVVKEKGILDLKEYVLKKDHQMQALTYQLSESNNKVQALTIQLTQNEHDLNEIKKSKAWRLLLFIRRIRMRLAPHDSNRN